MSNAKKETIADIVREMREQANEPAIESLGEVFPPVGVEDVKDWADRIEAAAERERVKARRDAEIEWARIGYEERKAEEKREPGDAAAMREALEWLREIIGDWNASDAPIQYCQYCNALDNIDAALSAPARNCDRFATAEDAVCTWLDAHPDAEHPNWRGLAQWLFAKAEGGAE